MIIKRTHIILKFSWGGEKKDKDLLATFKKHLYPKICGILKLKNSKNFPRIYPKF
jgi:hypothetical protein